MSPAIRSPHASALSGLSTTELLNMWQDARSRTVLAERTPADEPMAEDYWTELAIGTRLADEVTCGRWCAVAALLKNGGVDSWFQVGIALGVTEAEARAGFHLWISRQVDLRHDTSSTGLTEDDAEALYVLSEGIAW